MNKLIGILLLLFGINMNAQNTLSTDSRTDYDTLNVAHRESMTAACGTPFLSTGYPAWANYWGGFQVKLINTNACPIVISGFEARFQGTTGYRIYTKTGTFVGFETTAGAWTLVGNLPVLTGTSTTAPTTIPILMSIVIPAGASQSFYLTRSDNVVGNRHLYVTGVGTPGTTVYASDANLSITEGCYVDPYFAALQVGTRRPSFDVCYTVNCALPIQLLYFTGKHSDAGNVLTWKTATELNNEFFVVEKSNDGMNWEESGRVTGAGTSQISHSYLYTDNSVNHITYYRLSQIDYNGQRQSFNIIAVESTNDGKTIKNVKCYNMLGSEVDCQSPGIHVEVTEYINSEKTIKKIQN